MDSIRFSTLILPRKRWNCPSNMTWANLPMVYHKTLTPNMMSRIVKTTPRLLSSLTSRYPTVEIVMIVM